MTKTRLKRAMLYVFEVLVVLLAVWIILSGMEVMVKAVGENPKYCGANLIVWFINTIDMLPAIR